MKPDYVMIIDDEASIRDILAKELRQLGYRCKTASSGSEALDILQNHVFDIILSDICMPGLNGIEFMGKAKRIIPEVSFIMITGFAKDYSFESIMKAGAADLIYKPFKLKEIEFKIERVLRERQLANENKRLLHEQVVLNERFSRILKMSRDLTAEMPFDRLFERIIRETTEIMAAQRTSLYLVDREKGEIWTKVAEQIDPIRLPIGQGISGRVAENGETVNIEDAWELPYFKREFDLKNHFRTRSVLCMAVDNRKKERIAVIQVLNKKGGGRFEKNDEIILAAIASQVAITIENFLLINELQISFESSIRTLSATVDARHPLTAGHSQRVTEYSLLIADELGLGDEEKQVIKYAALLHDIGKIGIRDEVLLKGGAFTKQEKEEMSTHPLRTRQILDEFHFPRSLVRVPSMASQHHEKVNGKGYPYGLTGDELSLGSKILAVSDVFDALTSRRDYPKHHGEASLNYDPMPLSMVIRILKEDSGSHFNPDVVDAFMRCMPRALELYRGTHFKPEYVDGMIQKLTGGDLSLSRQSALQIRDFMPVVSRAGAVNSLSGNRG